MADGSPTNNAATTSLLPIHRLIVVGFNAAAHSTWERVTGWLVPLAGLPKTRPVRYSSPATG